MPINCTDCVFLTGQSSPQQPCLFWFLLIPGTGVTSNEQALRRIPSLGWRPELQQPLTPFRQNSSHCQLRRMRGDTRRVGAWFGLKLCQCTACRVQHPSDGRLSADCSAAQRFPLCQHCLTAWYLRSIATFALNLYLTVCRFTFITWPSTAVHVIAWMA